MHVCADVVLPRVLSDRRVLTSDRFRKPPVPIDVENSLRPVAIPNKFKRKFTMRDFIAL